MLFLNELINTHLRFFTLFNFQCSNLESSIDSRYKRGLRPVRTRTVPKRMKSTFSTTLCTC